MKTSSLQQAVAEVILPVLPAEAGLDNAAIAELLAPPPNRDLGDLAFPCFRLAKALRNAPPKIAAELAHKLATDGLLESATAAGPYINLRLHMGRAATVVLPPLAKGLPESGPAQADKVMVEYSQPNTHKAFHVGHMRNVSLGDALVRLLRADGFEVVAANYLGDVGAHIAKCLWWFLDHLDEDERGNPPDEARGEWLGELYSAASNQLDEWSDAAKGGDAQAQTKLDGAKARTAQILQKLEARDPNMIEVWNTTRQWSLDEFAEIYDWSMVHFDRVFYESEVDEPGLALVEEHLQTGVFVRSEGAVGVFNEEVKHMPFFMLRKTDGTSLYATKDLALAKLKFEEYAVDRSIYVVDTRQSDHFRHVFATLRKMGFAQAEKCEHVPYEMVELPSGAMATRKGNVILFRALRERMLTALESQYLGKYRNEWPDEEVDRTAHYLALGAIKYGMLNRDHNQKIVFDLDAWSKLEGDTGPYIQYAAARAGSILRKAEASGNAYQPQWLDEGASLLAALGQPEERELCVALDAMLPTVHQAAQTLRPSVMCTYLYNLAKSVHRFANAKNCNVIRSEGDLRRARLVLVKAAREGLRWGLWRLGIPAPDRM